MKDNLEERDELERFIIENREAFDDLNPKEDSWMAISSELTKERSDYSWLWKAAAVLFLGLSIVLLLERNGDDEANKVAIVVENTMEDIPEWQQAEGYYTQLISQKRIEIKTVIATNNYKDMELLDDLDQLDSLYLNLKDNLDENQNDQRVINAMIRNLQLRVEILNRQLKILENITKYQEHEKISV